MKKIAIAVAAVALFAGAANAASSVSGTVSAYNAEARVITFDNGKSVSVPLDVAIPASLQVGGQASIAFDSEGDRVNAVFTR
ncbi:hypothetical protein [Oryzicola mucosus]|uniref:DUF1344 domain-containing protein n=1 Tax=Oryzicola mucosus TaxID=2767425 RepID=A0A8J6Q460_9HYPH|nr:hypothetical protein [Oryzicola mucosus]MBD0415700.1 hypothetical protein [Oryzicola mucosus]